MWCKMPWIEQSLSSGQEVYRLTKSLSELQLCRVPAVQGGPSGLHLLCSRGFAVVRCSLRLGVLQLQANLRRCSRLGLAAIASELWFTEAVSSCARL